MALTPITFEIDTEEFEEEETTADIEVGPSLTFNIRGKRLGALIDGKEAIQQFIEKAIRTARSNYLIYDDSYGSDIDYIISQSLPLDVLQIELPRLIEEALISDDRIDSVSDFNLSQEKDGLLVEFTVELTNGEIIANEVIL